MPVTPHRSFMPVPYALAVSLFGLLFGPLFGAASAHAAVTAHTGHCTEPAGRSFQVSYTMDSQSSFVRVTDLQVRSSASQPWTPFNDGAGTFAKLEWWSGDTFHDLYFDPTPEGFSYPWVTLAIDQAGYDHWWVGRDGRTAILGQPVYSFLNPRVEFRSVGNAPLNRQADSCDVYLDTWTAGSGTAAKRVAHIGDSISDQMTPKLNQLNTAAGRKFFIDAQSGQSYQSMIGEARGIAGGLRLGVSTAPAVPDVLVIALGTNDVGSVYFNPDFNAWKTGLGWIVSRLLVDTANIGCRVVMTVRDAGRDPDKLDSRLASAADAYNTLIKQAVANNPARYRLVDWNALAANHRPGSPQEWFSLNPFSPPSQPEYDRTHPNAAGLTALSDEILQKTNACLTGTP